MCQRDGSWSGDTPHCAAITCPLLPSIARGFTHLELRIPGEKARFGCDLGWRLEGGNNITCNSEGQWEGALPSCEPVLCPDIDDHDNVIRVTQHKNSYSVGDVVQWRCDDDLVLSGADQVTCLPTGDWSSAPPSCVRPECSKVIPVNNGIVFGMKNTDNGTEVNFSCDNGYYKVPHSGVQCSVDGSWSGPVPVCARYECPVLTSPDHGAMVTRASHDGGYQAQFSCDHPYEIVGHKTLQCSGDGSWSGPVPECVITYCPMIPRSPMMILMTGARTVLGDSAQFKCEPGFSLVGDQWVKCLESGDWETSFPVCAPLQCQVKRQLRYGHLQLIPSHFKTQIWSRVAVDDVYEDLSDASVVTVGDKLHASCDAGYEVSGDATVECLPSTLLNTALPRCRQKYCHELPDIDHGWVVSRASYRGAAVSYQCDAGYRLVGSRSRKCRRNKTWSNTAPRCEIVQCHAPHNMAHGEVDYNSNKLEYGTVITYSCHLGYEIVGVNTRVCGAGGQWEGPEPECVQVRCPIPRIPLHGDQEILSLVVGGKVKYQCNTGYTLTGSSMITCLGNKTWSQLPPVCERIYCAPPDKIKHGVALVTSLEYQSSVEYKCDTGHTMLGHHSLSCLHSGHWSAPAPQCVANVCPVISVEHGHVSHDQSRVPGDVATVTCDLGYKILGPSRLVCQPTLEWSVSTLPSCVMVTCGHPPQVDNAISHADGFSYLDSANYTCLPGYEIRV